MVSQTHYCKANTVSGDPCKAPATLVDKDGFCHAHAPGASERLSEAGRKGAAASAQRFRTPGLDSSALGDLETITDAQRWLRAIGRGAVTVSSKRRRQRPAYVP